jgi:hypothetical protein
MHHGNRPRIRVWPSHEVLIYSSLQPRRGSALADMVFEITKCDPGFFFRSIVSAPVLSPQVRCKTCAKPIVERIELCGSPLLTLQG